MVALSALILTACGGSKKGAWSDDDKDKFKTKCNTEIGKV